MKYCFTACFVLTIIIGTAQTFPKKTVDSLTAVIFSQKNNHPLKINRDSVLPLLWKSNSAAERIAMFYDIVDNSDELTPDRSLYYHQLILEGAKKNGDKVLEAAVMAELGYINCMNGNTAGGLKMIYNSLEQAEATGNAQAIGIAYNNLGNCYPNNLQMSRDYMSKALAYSRKGNDYLFVCYDLGNLGNMFLQEQKRDSALVYCMEAYRLAAEKHIDVIHPLALLGLSKLDKPRNKLGYYRQASQMPFAIRNSGAQISIASATANFFIENKRMDSAFYYATKMYHTAGTASLTTQLGALSLMAYYYRTLPNTDSALSYLERFYSLKDSLYGSKVMEQAQSMAYNDMQRQKEVVAQKAAFQNKLILYLLSAVAVFLMGLAFIFWRSKRKELQAKKILQQQKSQIEETLDKLKSTQSQLIQSEKMASLGELTAGIAHEIQNPLNFVNNFSEVNAELIKEMVEEVDKGNLSEVKLIAKDIQDNEEKINHHGKRADAIVKGMLQHSRSSSGQKELTDINALADEYLRLAYHGIRAKDKSFNATLKTDYDERIHKINMIPQDIGRVILNLITNAFYAVAERKKQTSNNYEPTVTVRTSQSPPLGGRGVVITVSDNGTGIPKNIKDKIFQPFFTTKPTGQGTGLGLSLSYDIIKAHGGELTVETKENEGTTFMIELPNA